MFFLLSSFFFLSSCSEKINVAENNSSTMDDEQTYFIQNYEVSANDFQFIGEAHNLGLSYIYENYISGLSELPSETEFEVEVIQLSENFVNNVFVPSQVYPPFTISSTIFDNYKDTSKFVNEIATYLSAEQLTIFLQIKNVFYISNSNIALGQLDNIDVTINNIINEDEKIFLWSAVAVARYSIQYWTSSEGQAWINKINSLNEVRVNSLYNVGGSIKGIDDPSKVCDINWGAVGYADFSGFCNSVKNNAAKIAVCAVRGAIIGALNTGGLGAVPGAILGAAGGALRYGIAGAVAMSAGCIAFQLAFGSL